MIVAKSAYTAKGDWYLTLIGNVERDRKLNVMCDRQKWTSYIGGLCSFETRDDRVKGLRKGSRESRHETDSAIVRAIFYVYNICISLQSVSFVGIHSFAQGSHSVVV